MNEKGYLRYQRYTVRFTKDEVIKIENEMKQLGIAKVSTYIRRKLFEEEYQRRKLQSDLTYEINKIGVNINQLAKDYNSYMFTKRDQQELVKRQIELNRLVQKYIDMLADEEGN